MGGGSLISLKDYAKDNGISYEAVRQQVKRYSEDLEGHIRHEGRTQLLDDTAVAILDSHRARNPVAVYDRGRDKEIHELEEEIIRLEAEVDLYKTKLIDVQEMIIAGENAQALIAAAKTQQKLLEEARDDYKQRLDKKEQELTEARKEAMEALVEASDTKKDREVEEKARRAAELEASELRRQLDQELANQEAAWAEFDKLPFWKKPFYKRPKKG